MEKETLKPELQSPLIFGADPTTAIVALELSPEGDQVIIYRRKGDQVVSETRPYRPWLLTGEDWLVEKVGDLEPEVEELSGRGYYRFRVSFPGIKEAERAHRRMVDQAKKKGLESDAVLFYRDQRQAYMMLSGTTQFKGITFHELRRMQIDIEVVPEEGFEFPNPERDGDRLRIISVRGWEGFEEQIVLREESETAEREMLERLNELIAQLDPDVIEGHYIFKFDLPYIHTRAGKLGVKLPWGRDGSPVSQRRSRMEIAERVIDYQKFTCHGRHIIDTWILTQHYDITHRTLTSLGLKEVAKHLGVAGEDRIYLDMTEVRRLWDEERDRLLTYAVQDVRETDAISQILSPPWFTQAMMLPFPYQDVVVRGNATRIDALLVREYLRQGRAIPKGQGGPPEVGGFTGVFMLGKFTDVLHADVASMHPSNMLVYEIRPRQDELGIFLEALKVLRELRLNAKRAMGEAKDEAERVHYDALQSTLKVLINSFYGYLGASARTFHFSDQQAATEVSLRGRSTLAQICQHLISQGSKLIEVDTDGVYFLGPPEVREGKITPDQLIEEIDQRLGREIAVEVDGRYPAMFSYKEKNYALLTDDGELIIKGSALRSRGLEPFQRELIEITLRYILSGREEEIEGEFERYRQMIREGTIPIEKLARSETLKDSLEVYRQKVEQKKRNKSAAYEIALRSSRNYVPGDIITYYITGTDARVSAYDNARPISEYDPQNPDVNVAYYLEKLEKRWKWARELIELARHPQEVNREELGKLLAMAGEQAKV